MASTYPATYAAPARLENGECCLRKPVDYWLNGWQHPDYDGLYCHKCRRLYDRKAGVQVANHAWRPAP